MAGAFEGLPDHIMVKIVGDARDELIGAYPPFAMYDRPRFSLHPLLLAPTVLGITPLEILHRLAFGETFERPNSPNVILHQPTFGGFERQQHLPFKGMHTRRVRLEKCPPGTPCGCHHTRLYSIKAINRMVTSENTIEHDGTTIRVEPDALSLEWYNTTVRIVKWKNHIARIVRRGNHIEGIVIDNAELRVYDRPRASGKYDACIYVDNTLLMRIQLRGVDTLIADVRAYEGQTDATLAAMKEFITRSYEFLQ